MKNTIMFLNIIFSLTLLSFSSCTIEGEEICGIWNARGDYGTIQMEITPWDGKFLGYLLEYQNGSQTIKGAKETEYIFITDLEYKNNQYQRGKIYLDPSTEKYCGLSLEMSSKNQLKAIYTCDGQRSEEIWYRKGSSIPRQITQTSDTTNKEIKKTGQLTARTTENSEKNTVKSSKKETSPVTVKPKATSITKVAAPQAEGDTQKQPTFQIIGIQEVVKYTDLKAMEKAVETLWTQAYNNDFSSKLENIIDQNNVYVSYSSYDQPKGMMRITLGYKVADLSSIPTNLKGVKIPMNDYMVYPLSGEKSDYEGEGWEQLGELMQYRKAESADFEVYTFDKNYSVKMAEMWIATK